MPLTEIEIIECAGGLNIIWCCRHIIQNHAEISR